MQTQSYTLMLTKRMLLETWFPDRTNRKQATVTYNKKVHYRE